VPVSASKHMIYYLLSSDKENVGRKVSVAGLTDVAFDASQLCWEKYHCI
jgi:hypothetical protein